MPYKKEWVEPELLGQLYGENESIVNVYAHYVNDDIEMLDDQYVEYTHVDKDGEVIDEGTIYVSLPSGLKVNLNAHLQAHTLGYIAALIDTGTLKSMKD